MSVTVDFLKISLEGIKPQTFGFRFPALMEPQRLYGEQGPLQSSHTNSITKFITKFQFFEN